MFQNGLGIVAGVEQSTVVLPCGPDQFSNFISSLLGRPQEITGTRTGEFAVDQSTLAQLHHLVTQRVEQQHGVRPIQFTARVVFDNGTSILLNSFSDFTSYNEVRSVRSVAVHLNWVFLITFPGNQTPEKQEIEFSCQSAWSQYDRMERNRPLGDHGYLGYRISHTARTWGADIEGLLAHYIDGVLKKENPIRIIIREHSGIIGLVLGGTVLVLLLIGLGYVDRQVFVIQASILSSALNRGASVADKLDQIILYYKVQAESARTVYAALYIVFTGAVSLITGIWAGDYASSQPPADVLLTNAARDFYKLRKAKYETSIRNMLLSLISAFVLGLIVNTVYDFVLKNKIEESITKYQASKVETLK